MMDVMMKISLSAIVLATPLVIGIGLLADAADPPEWVMWAVLFFLALCTGAFFGSIAGAMLLLVWSL